MLYFLSEGKGIVLNRAKIIYQCFQFDLQLSHYYMTAKLSSQVSKEKKNNNNKRKLG